MSLSPRKALAVVSILGVYGHKTSHSKRNVNSTRLRRIPRHYWFSGILRAKARKKVNVPVVIQ